ncbi:hypothetical protein A9Q98_09570 [Thalassotalea sp. 42_200_T64]|nr:hypothetical protein A9Q98_09570 [Thalassotalea sp. 42_200_T64]
MKRQNILITGASAGLGLTMANREQNFGHLVTISSVSSQCGFAKSMTVYAATKAALASLTEGIGIDVPNTPIRVTTIHPGYIATEITNPDKKLPFIVNADVGCKAIIKAIEKEVNVAFVPFWPLGNDALCVKNFTCCVNAQA